MVGAAQDPRTDIERRLTDLGVALPAPPTPLGVYVEAVQSGSLLILTGMLPVVRGQPQFVGRLGGMLTVEEGYEATRTACLNGLAVAKQALSSLNKVVRVVKLGVYIATEGDFHEHPRVADGASELLLAAFGSDKLPPRIVLGVASIPLGMAVEVELVFETEL